MRTVGVITVGRSDYGCYLPLLNTIRETGDLDLYLMVTGTHLSSEFGMTVQNIEADGFEIKERVEMLISSDTPEAIAKSMGIGTMAFGQVFSRYKPDVLVVLGDRFEMHSAVVASIPYKVPVAHIHGGESTEGALDEGLRHSITKLSHLHFVSTEQYADRVIAMGEEPWRVTVSGAPSLDNISGISLLGSDDLQYRIGLDLSCAPMLVTLHPPTLGINNTNETIDEILCALHEMALPVVFTYPNADQEGRIIIDKIHHYTSQHPNSTVVTNLGTQAYFSLMNSSMAMLGNSSSGIIEAASFKLPVINVGDRQKGRLKPSNVVDVGVSKEDIISKIQWVNSDEFRDQMKDLVNPYGDGMASQRIISKIKDVPLDSRLLQKRFHDVQRISSD